MKRADIIANLKLGPNIKRLREERKISQEKLADGICDRTTISKLENGSSKILSFVFVVQICDKLNLTVDEFLNNCLNNTYKLNKDDFIDLLFKKDYKSLTDKLNTIEYEALSYKDKSFYNYLIAKLYLKKKLPEDAKRHLLLALNDTINFKFDNSTKALVYYELVKNNLIIEKNNTLNKVYLDSLLHVEIKDSSFIYLLDNALKDSLKIGNYKLANILLEKELYIINSTNKYKYLPLYYKNKIELNKDNKNIVNDSLNKLSAIQNNKTL